MKVVITLSKLSGLLRGVCFLGVNQSEGFPPDRALRINLRGSLLSLARSHTS
jgi:hypothetical protein